MSDCGHGISVVTFVEEWRLRRGGALSLTGRRFGFVPPSWSLVAMVVVVD